MLVSCRNEIINVVYEMNFIMVELSNYMQFLIFQRPLGKTRTWLI